MFIFDEFDIKLDRKKILETLQCYEDSDSYDVFLDAYEKIVETTKKIIKPKAVIEFGHIPEAHYHTRDERQEGLYVMFTVGGGISTLSGRLFSENKYVQGMLVDAIADDYLFQMDQLLRESIMEVCKANHVYTKCRLEAPGNIPMEMQKIAYEICQADKSLQIEIKESMMFDPIKSFCLVYELAQGEGDFSLEHDCTSCDNIECKRRKIVPVEIRVISGDQEIEFIYRGEDSLLAVLRKRQIYINAECGGIGICGKCKIQCISGQLEVTKSDKKIFTKQELQGGYRLACMAYPKQNLSIKILESEEKMQILTLDQEDERKEDQNAQEIKAGDLGIAIDIGTTTLAMVLVRRKTGKILLSYTGVNHQKSFGVDVISRIQASNDGKRLELQKIIKNDLLEGIRELSRDFCLPIEQIIISANTTMIHLLMNYSCEQLGRHPYLPVYNGSIYMNMRDMFAIEKNIPVYVMPGISAFVGGDIVSGLYYLDYMENIEHSIFLDLGTNGELVVGNKEKILCTSTAAGPAFEGGKLSSGVASVAGAIYEVKMNKDTKKMMIRTIFDKEAIGICGTGVIDAISLMLETDLIDETGLLDDPYFENGYLIYKTQDLNKTKQKEIRITQKDIREIQLAKAAILAGLETLLEEYGKDRVTKMYLAGGFGKHVNIEHMIKVGVLPVDFEKKIVVVGNSSLLGAVKLLMSYGKEQESEIKIIEQCVHKVEKIDLADKKFFQEQYLKNMYFNT